MSHHIALYRKYRPQKFSEVAGQGHIVDVLESAIKNQKISHAYLFVGSRGTGKTSVARIFARELGVGDNDLYEIDAASNRGIEDIKALRDGARTLPFDSKYKIYIIDEAHMLSKDAWGALLKTLEEPPKHVIFILATTESEKVPETILSRCQTFVFRKPSEATLKNVLNKTAKEEGIELEEEAVSLLSIAGDGSFRDGLGILEKVLNFYAEEKQEKKSKSKKISREEVEKIIGAPKNLLVRNFLMSLSEKDEEKCLSLIKETSELNLDLKFFLKLIIEKLRLAIILSRSPKEAEEMLSKTSEEDREFLKNLIEKDKKEVLKSDNLAILLSAYADFDNTFIQELPLELAVMKIFENKENKQQQK